MKVTITGRHLSVSDAMKTYAEEKIQKLSRFNKVSRIQLTMNAEGDRQIAEMIVSAPQGKQIVITEQTQDMYASIDRAVDRVERKLRKQKDKMKKPLRRVKEVSISETSSDSDDEDFDDYDEDLD